MAHILNTPGAAERTGWSCPSCSRAYAPWVYSCPHCPARTESAGTFTGVPFLPVLFDDPYPERRRPEYCWRSWPPRHTETCGCGTPSGGPVLKLPEHMGNPDKIHRALIPQAWREVFPGLEARFGGAVGAEASVDFRLTPEGGRGHE